MNVDDHAYFLQISEGREHGTPRVYITPVWAERDSHDPVTSYAHDTPHHGLTDLAYTGFWYPGDEAPNFKWCAMQVRPSLGELEHIIKVFRKTEKAQTRFLDEMGQQVTHGQRCLAWAKTFKMHGVLYDKTLGDSSRYNQAFSSAIAHVIDNYIDAWMKRNVISNPAAQQGGIFMTG